MIEVLKLKEMVEEKLEPYRHTFREMRRQKKKKVRQNLSILEHACLPFHVLHLFGLCHA